MADSHVARPVARLLGRWAAATFTLDARSLALFRIAAGCTLVADCLLRTRDFRLMFAADGIFPPQALAHYHADPTLWSLAFLDDGSWWGAAVLGLEGLAGAALVAGYNTGLASVVAWIALVSVIRRTAPATNSGDVWLACQLFWAMFLPLGARWSRDAAAADPARPRIVAARSAASAALVLQLAAVYVGAGLAKCNADWFAGDALSHALSVHDHGTPLGMLLARIPWLVRPGQWGVLCGELVLPLILVAIPSPRVRGTIVALFISFHVVIWMTMTVGLFAAIGIVAWLPLIPAAAWPASTAVADGRVAVLGRTARWTCGLACLVAAASFLHEVTPWRSRSLARPLVAAINVTCLEQRWHMFGGVPAQEQWVYGRAELADGTVVDLLRGGAPLERDRPAGGFTSLPHHRWHKFFWVLPLPRVRVFAAPAAAALARDWNARHGPERQVVSLEIRQGVQAVRGGDGTIVETLLASWPARSADGAGNLDRFLEEASKPDDAAVNGDRSAAGPVP